MSTNVRARACVNLAGLRFGQEALVDPSDPYIAGLLRGGLLVRIEDVVEPEAVSEGESPEGEQGESE